MVPLFAALVIAVPLFAGPTSIKDLPIDHEKQAFVTEVLTKMGLSNDVTVVIDPKAAGCAWAGLVDGRQLIGVDPACTGPLRNGDSFNSFALFVTAHELGHLLQRHDRSSNPPEESQADEFAGWLMARVGSTLEDTRASARRMDETGGKTHPPRYARIIAVELGWTRGAAFNIPGQTEGVAKREPETKRPPEPAPPVVVTLPPAPEPERKQPEPPPLPSPAPKPPVVPERVTSEIHADVPPQERPLPPAVLTAAAVLAIGLLLVSVLKVLNQS